MNVAVVGDEDDLFSIRRPGWTDLVIKGAVVIARQRAAHFPRQLLDDFTRERRIVNFVFAPLLEIENKNVKVAGFGGGNVRDAIAIGRPARFNIYSIFFGERSEEHTSELQSHSFISY